MKLISSILFSTDTEQKTKKQRYGNVAEDHVPALAQDVYEKIVYIRKNGASRIELVGHNIGAHVAAQTGKLLKSKMEYTVDQIFGNDCSINIIIVELRTFHPLCNVNSFYRRLDLLCRKTKNKRKSTPNIYFLNDLTEYFLSVLRPFLSGLL